MATNSYTYPAEVAEEGVWQDCIDPELLRQ